VENGSKDKEGQPQEGSEIIGKNIKRLRNALHMKQGDFAAKIGYERKHLSQVENGAAEASPRMIGIICHNLRVDPDWLRTGKGAMFQGGNGRAEDGPFPDVMYAVDPLFKEIVDIYHMLDDEQRDRLLSLARERRQLTIINQAKRRRAG
jgi:transcriptional regulator with XRE-family HTH domain